MSDDKPLNDAQIDAIAERLIEKVKSHHHEFWIDPEEHYRDHMRIRSMWNAFSAAQSIFWRAFLGLSVLGAIILSGYAAVKKFIA